MNNDYMQTPTIADKKLKRGSIPEIFGEGADFDKDSEITINDVTSLIDFLTSRSGTSTTSGS